MEKKLELFIDGCVNKPLDFVCSKIVNAGYTGRNQASVHKHIEELKTLGIAAPEKIPCYYPKPAALVKCTNVIEVVDTDSSGEAEFVLLVGKDEVYVAAGSDHTDRKLEAESAILKGKQIYPNVISRAVWRLCDVEDHWDDIVMRAWVDGDPKHVYQEAKLSALLGPRDLMARVEPLVGGNLVGTAIYSGTVATIGEIRFSNKFETMLVDDKRGQKLYCGYSICPTTWFQG
ncbi:MAG: DUF2848 family protein [Acidobacteriaceae bacterium]